MKPIIERAFVVAQGAEIKAGDIRLRSSADAMGEGMLRLSDPVDLDSILSALEKRYIVAALEAGKSRHAAAVLLGLTERSLRYRMDKLGIKEEMSEH